MMFMCYVYNRGQLGLSVRNCARTCCCGLRSCSIVLYVCSVPASNWRTKEDWQARN